MLSMPWRTGIRKGCYSRFEKLTLLVASPRKAGLLALVDSADSFYMYAYCLVLYKTKPISEQFEIRYQQFCFRICMYMSMSMCITMSLSYSVHVYFYIHCHAFVHVMFVFMFKYVAMFISKNISYPCSYPCSCLVHVHDHFHIHVLVLAPV
jgi:hypothetical protein